MINTSIYNALQSLKKIQSLYDSSLISIEKKHKLKFFLDALQAEDDFYNQQTKNIINEAVESKKAKIVNGKINFETSEDSQKNLLNFNQFSRKMDELKNFQVYFSFSIMRLSKEEIGDLIISDEDVQNLAPFIVFGSDENAL